MAQQYDVIIIGSGGGRRHARSASRPVRQENSAARGRGDWLLREPENWSAEAVFVDNRYVSKDVWYDKHGKAFQPGVHYFVGGATKMYGAALYRLRQEDFADGVSTRTASHRRGRSATTSSNPTTSKPRRCTTSTAPAGKIPLSPLPAGRILILRSHTNRGSKNSPTTSLAPVTTHSTRRAASS